MQSGQKNAAVWFGGGPEGEENMNKNEKETKDWRSQSGDIFREEFSDASYLSVRTKTNSAPTSSTLLNLAAH